MLGRWAIRLAASLIGIAAGLILSVALLSDFSGSTTAIVQATILFWIVHIIVNFFAVKVLIRQPSVAMAGLLALASTIIALIIWITTAVADVIGGRMIRDRRIERHS